MTSSHFMGEIPMPGLFAVILSSVNFSPFLNFVKSQPVNVWYLELENPKKFILNTIASFATAIFSESIFCFV